MKSLILSAAASVVLVTSPALAQSGAPAGAAAGAVGGAIVGGPVGAVVGGVIGATAGGMADAQQGQFRQYVVTRGVPSYRYAEPLAVGTVLPGDGITYYEVPAEYGLTGHRYAVVNERIVIVGPDRRAVQIIQR
jgi:hypothetical protein